MAAGLHAVAGRLGHGQTDRRLADEPGQQPDRVRPAADAGDGEVRQASLDRRELGRSLVADPALEVPDDGRVGMRPHRGAQDVVGRLDVRHPVAHRLVDGVLERGRARGDRADLGAQRAHPQDVGSLALDVLGAHVHDARQLEQGAGRCRRDAVLSGPGLGDDPRLAEASGQQRLAQRVVDLVGAGVGEVLALEVEADRGQRRPGRSPARRSPSARTASASRSARYNAVGRPANRSSSTRRSAQNTGSWRSASYAVSSWASAAISVSGTYRPPKSRSIPHRPAPSASSSPAWTGVGPNGDVRTVVAGGTGSLHEQGDLERVLARPLPGVSRRLDAARDIDTDGRDLAQRRGHVGRAQPAGQHDRDLARDRGTQPWSRHGRRCRRDAARRRYR